MSAALRYLEHLSDGDLDLVARVGVAGHNREQVRTRMRESPRTIEAVLASPRLYEAVFADPKTLSSRVSPFLAFSTLVHRTVSEMEKAPYVFEWAGPGKRIPVFDADSMASFLGDPRIRFFFAELLTSFVRIASGSMWVLTPRGYRRKRFSELDPVQLVEVVEQLPTAQRPGGYRRLGDVTLFLTGVFPDHTATHTPSVSQRRRLAASAGLAPLAALDEGNDLRFHEILGASWYRRAASAQAAGGAGVSHLDLIADQFTQARRFLNLLTDRHLHRYDPGLASP